MPRGNLESSPEDQEPWEKSSRVLPRTVEDMAKQIVNEKEGQGKNQADKNEKTPPFLQK